MRYESLARFCDKVINDLYPAQIAAHAMESIESEISEYFPNRDDPCRDCGLRDSIFGRFSRFERLLINEASLKSRNRQLCATYCWIESCMNDTVANFTAF